MKLKGVKSWNNEVRPECNKFGEPSRTAEQPMPICIVPSTGIAKSTSWDGLHSSGLQPYPSLDPVLNAASGRLLRRVRHET